MAEERRYIAAHNGLRGIAALLVIFYHLQFGADYRLGFETATNFFEQSYLMVDLFFILSGFIISFTARPDGRTMARQECRKFYRMRVARIFPLHVFCLLYLSVFFAAFAAYLTWQGQPLDQDRWGPMGADLARRHIVSAGKALQLEGQVWRVGGVGDQAVAVA